uniref:TRASH domain-containing protein n=1 Tax=Hippocampus comes TaxID=109280 RepID=A0A3Q3DB84_HIPCM
MGLGDFADSSQGSNTSSKSGGLEGTKAADEISGLEAPHHPDEDSSNSSSRQQEKIGEGVEESSSPRIASPVTDQRSSFTMGPSEGGGSGEAAFDDALDGLPSFGPEEEEEEDEDWHFALPAETLQDDDCDKSKCKSNQLREKHNKIQEDRSPLDLVFHKSFELTALTMSSVKFLKKVLCYLVCQRSEAPPVEDSNPPISPNITIKDEPIDEGYNAALQPQTTVRQIKEELDHQEVTHQVAAPAPPQTAIFIPGRGAVLQAVTPLSVRPPAAIQTSLTSLSPLPLRPPVPTIPGSVRCSGCFKVLLKGQTAFQRKGSTQLFCSTVCLTGHLPPTTKNQLCSLCNSEILRARDTITIPADDNTYLHFCGQHCLSIFRHRTKKIEKAPEKVIEHEVSHQGRLHKLCSDACFVTWRKMRQLAMNCCEGCGLYCSSSSDSYHTLTIEKSELNFCGPTCIGTYKQVSESFFFQKERHDTPKISAIVSATIMERDDKGKVQLYCSPVCVQMSRPPLHTLTGAAFPCCLCKNVAVPQYHLAMVDGTIRNFCSFDCVSTFRVRVVQELDASRLGPSSRASSVPPIPQDYPSSAPYPSHHGSNSSVPPLVPPSLGLTSTSVPGQGHPRTPTALSVKPAEGGPNDGPKVTCHQCTKQFITKPLLFGHKVRQLLFPQHLHHLNSGTVDQISVFCSMVCCDVYKTVNNILVMCEVCRKDMVPFDTIHYNGKDIFFCSKHCKQNFKICITSRNKDPPCRPCSYCYSISQRMLHSHYGGKLEEFCKPLCMSQYTVLYYGMGRCDSCRKQGYLNEKLQYMGSVRNFCNLTCLLGYCSLNFQSTQHTPSNGTGAEQPHGLPNSSVDGKILDHVCIVSSIEMRTCCKECKTSTLGLCFRSQNVQASTQTDTMRGPPLYRRQMKNKSVLCRPFTMDQETPSPPSSNCSTEEEQVKMLMVPIPVPVFIPVPMNMYSQHTPVPLAMPITVQVAPPTIHQVEESPNTAQTKIPPPILEVEGFCPTSARSVARVLISEQKCACFLHFFFSTFLLTQGRRRTVSKDRSAVVPPVSFSLNYMYGVKAWKNWVQLHNTHSRRSNPVIIKEEILQCDSAELSYALSCFIKEVRRPNGEAYSPDSIFYLCLGIQQVHALFGRIENIFTDELYSQFAMEISGMLRLWKPKQLPNGSPVSSRVEESFLWECKQLGAYSPIVLLNTLLFFYTKNFHFTTLTQHQSLSFANFSLHTKPCSRAGKVLYLKYQRSSTATSSRGETGEEGDMEIAENVTNPLHCPVRLYEFYLSRCSYWYTCHTLHHTILQSMLTRILAVKELQFTVTSPFGTGKRSQAKNDHVDTCQLLAGCEEADRHAVERHTMEICHQDDDWTLC